jgi:hypothetical protein
MQAGEKSSVRDLLFVHLLPESEVVCRQCVSRGPGISDNPHRPGVNATFSRRDLTLCLGGSLIPVAFLIITNVTTLISITETCTYWSHVSNRRSQSFFSQKETKCGTRKLGMWELLQGSQADAGYLTYYLHGELTRNDANQRVFLTAIYNGT